jgi:hypothetical protein
MKVATVASAHVQHGGGLDAGEDGRRRQRQLDAAQHLPVAQPSARPDWRMPSGSEASPAWVLRTIGSNA